MKKKCFSIMIAFCFAMTTMVLAATDTYAATSINTFQVQDRVTKLSKNYNNTYFTNVNGVYGKKDPNSKAYHRSYDCKYCLAANVVKTSKVKGEYKNGVTISYLPEHWSKSGGSWVKYSATKSKGDSCCGFACYAGYYIFGNGVNTNVSGNRKYYWKYDYSNISRFNNDNLKVGDILRFDNSHSAIYYGKADKNGFYVIDCNWGSEVCKVTKHYIPYSSYKYVSTTRGNNATLARMGALTAKKKSTSVQVSWSAVKGADKYLVYRSTKANSGYSLVKTTTGKSYTDTSAKKGITYYYKVKAGNNFNGKMYYTPLSGSKSIKR